MELISFPEIMVVVGGVDDDEGIKMRSPRKTKAEAAMQGALCGLFAVLRSSEKLSRITLFNSRKE